PVILTQWSIGLHRAPARKAVAIDHIPVFVGNYSVFVTGPADVAVLEESQVGENKCVRLVRAQLLDDAWKVVDMPGAPGAVEPELFQIAVALRQLVELGGVVHVVLGAICVAGLVPIPRSKDIFRPSGHTFEQPVPRA